MFPMAGPNPVFNKKMMIMAMLERFRSVSEFQGNNFINAVLKRAREKSREERKEPEAIFMWNARQQLCPNNFISLLLTLEAGSVLFGGVFNG